jgi:putative CocE/NonD family hydrolase
VTTRDGTKVAIDVYLPAGLEPGERVPTVLIQTPYFRSLQFRLASLEKLVRRISLVGAAEFAEELARFGYANVCMDLRGAGASYGHKASLLMPDAVRDGGDVLDWIVAQPWSNGRVGTTGISGPGMAALWLACGKHPALRAVAPRFTVFDIFAGTHPGGLTASRFVRDVGRMLAAMDNNRIAEMSENSLARVLMRLLVKGLRPVDEDTHGAMLAEAVGEHAANEHFDEDILAVTYRDDPLPSAPGSTLDTQSPFAHAGDLSASGVALYASTGWGDGAFVNEMLNLHNSVSVPESRIVVGPWGHGGRWYSSPLQRRKRPTDFDHMAEMVRFFDAHLRDDSSAIEAEAPIHYFTMIEERWKATTTWPIEGTEELVLYLGPRRTLEWIPRDDSGRDEYAVDFTAGTGVHSRFGKHLSGGRYPVRYPGRAKRDSRLLVYTSEAVVADTEITGYPSLRLFLSSTATDGAVLVYLEDVGPDDEVECITDGGLRLATRHVSAEEPPYWMHGPWRPCRRADEESVTRGEVLELAFDLHPVSWLLQRGHAVRVAIAGADRDNFLAIGADQSPVLSVHYGPEAPSSVRLPIVPEHRRGDLRA